MVGHGLATGEDLRDELKTMLLEQGAKPLAIFRLSFTAGTLPWAIVTENGSHDA